MNSLKYLGVFLAGGAIGAGVCYKYMQNKCEARVQEEITSVKEAFSRKNPVEKKPKEEAPKPKLVIDENTENLRKEYKEYAGIYAGVEVDKMPDPNARPCVISPEEFSEDDDEEYPKITLYYFSDGVLTDDQYNEIDDVEETIGYDALNTYGDYEDDCVYVRNDARHCDYEVIRDLRNYSDILKTKPHHPEDE